MNIGLDITAEGSKFFVGGNLLRGALAIAEDALRRFLIAPEIADVNFMLSIVLVIV